MIEIMNDKREMKFGEWDIKMIDENVIKMGFLSIEKINGSKYVVIRDYDKNGKVGGIQLLVNMNYVFKIEEI